MTISFTSYCTLENKRIGIHSAIINYFTAVYITPSNLHIMKGDQGIVQCEVEYPVADSPPRSSVYINDCKQHWTLNHPSWVTKISESPGECVHSSHSNGQPLCLLTTIYINGTLEAHNSRIFCCARLNTRVCTINSTISVAGMFIYNFSSFIITTK